MKPLLLLSAVATAGAAFLLGRNFPAAAPGPDPVAPVAVKPAVKVTLPPDTPAQTVAQQPNTLAKRQQVLSLVDMAKTSTELAQLMQDFAGDETSEATIASRWAAVDPNACLKWLRGLQGRMPTSITKFSQALFGTWAANDPAAAMAAARQSQLLPGLQTASLVVVEAVLQRDLKAGGKLMAERGFFPDIYIFPENLWKVDPAGLVKALLPTGVVPDKNLAWALGDPLRAWSTKNPAEVLAWLQALPIEVSGPLLPHAVVGLAATDPKAASELIARVPQAAAREAAAASLAREWVARDGAAAFTYAITVGIENPALNLKWMAIKLIDGGDAGVLQAYQQLPPGKVRESVLPILANAWLDENPASASLFLATLPAGPERNDALKFIAKTWAEDAPEEALKFLRNNPGPELDEVYQRIVARHAGDDAISAVIWAVQQPPERALAGVRTAFNVMSTDYQMEDATSLLPKLPTAQLQTAAVVSFMEPFATGQRLFDEGLKWAATLSPELKAVARETILRSTLITPGERSRAEAKLR